MALTALITITLASIAWSLWIRRVTWHCRWEVAATLNIALQGCAVALMSPLSAETLGVALHRITGEWNLQNYVGHDCYIVAASAIVYNAVGRLADDDALQASFKQYVERPATLCIPLLLATFSLSYGSKTYARDFFELPTDFWLTVYWVLLCGTLAYLLTFGSRALLVLRQGPAVEEHRQSLPGRLGQRDRRLRGADHHRVDSAVPGAAGCGAGLVLRLPVRRWFCLDLCAILAAEDQVVPAAGAAALAGRL